MTRNKTATITIRLPRPLHAALKVLGHERRTSMNLLAVEIIREAVVKNEAAAVALAGAEGMERGAAS